MKAELFVLLASLLFLVSGCVSNEYDDLRDEMETKLSNHFSAEALCFGGKIMVMITNTGIDEIERDEITILIDNADASGGLESDIEVQGYGTVEWDCGGECDSGEHTIYLETDSWDSQTVAMC